MEKIINNKGITLVALVITIIILLILAGISIQAITNTGLFANAKKAKERTMEAQLKEELSLAIQSIQTEEIYKGNSVTLETLAGENGQLKNVLGDDLSEAEVAGDEINGEYKDYEFTIDSNLNVTINGTVSGAKITGSAVVQNSGYVFEGNTVEIKVTASITEGTIAGIETPEGATLKTNTSTTEKVYTVSKSGNYVFKITSDSGKTKNITAKVTSILETPQITVSEITGSGFKINVENNYPEGAITEYKYYVSGTVKQEGTTEKNCLVTGLTEGTECNNIKVVAYIGRTSKESNEQTVTTTITRHTAVELTYSWKEIAEMAQIISNTDSINEDTAEVKLTINNQEKILGVGDTLKLDEKTVRILGFNHDELVDPSAYGTTTATGKAGISFEYVDFLITLDNMSGYSSNSGGWASSAARVTLNKTKYSSLITTYKIKQVKKEYIETYNSASSKTTSNDYLWLLSCGEIWAGGYNGGDTRGLAIATEGKQYKYYKTQLASYGNADYRTSNNITKKKDGWWLRSPHLSNFSYFCYVSDSGCCTFNPADYKYGMAPGFSI